MPIKTVMAFGTFDLLHPGHIHYLRQAKAFGDRLVVVVARDITAKRMGKQLLFNEKERLGIISAIAEVDDARLGYERDMLRVIEDVSPDTICLGYDQWPEDEQLRETLTKRGIKTRIERAEPLHEQRYKSYLLKRRLMSR